MNVHEICKAVMEILEERGSDYETSSDQTTPDQQAENENSTASENSMATIVAAFNALTGMHLEEWHGWIFMTVLKMVRLQKSIKNPRHVDSALDLVGYAVKTAECVLKKKAGS